MKFDYSKASWAFSQDEIDCLSPHALLAHDMIHEKTGAGNGFLGWLDLPTSYCKEEFDRIKQVSQKIREHSKYLIVIGIGGSYLGAKMAVDFLTKSDSGVQILYAGNNISSTYLANIIKICKENDFSINVVSKSGTTTEPAIVFRILKRLTEKKYGVEGAKQRIFATTDRSRGALKKFADSKGYQTFVIPDDVGGRFSVLTACGLLPLAVSGADIDKIMEGAQFAKQKYDLRKVSDNHCYQYAVVRNILYRKGYTTEIMVNYEPSLHFFSEWWKQLFGESEGKDNKGLFPAAVDFSTDLHSLGQYVQDGLRNLFETVISVEKSNFSLEIPFEDGDADGLNFVAGKPLEFVNHKAFLGTLLAHTDGRVPNFVLSVEEQNEFNLGQLVYFFEKACAISGYILGVNPFDQPGVEAYKKNMFALLGKPGYEELAEALKTRIQ